MLETIETRTETGTGQRVYATYQGPTKIAGGHNYISGKRYLIRVFKNWVSLECNGGGLHQYQSTEDFLSNWSRLRD